MTLREKVEKFIPYKGLFGLEESDEWITNGHFIVKLGPGARSLRNNPNRSDVPAPKLANNLVFNEGALVPARELSEWRIPGKHCVPTKQTCPVCRGTMFVDCEHCRTPSVLDCEECDLGTVEDWPSFEIGQAVYEYDSSRGMGGTVAIVVQDIYADLLRGLDVRVDTDDANSLIGLDETGAIAVRVMRLQIEPKRPEPTK